MSTIIIGPGDLPAGQVTFVPAELNLGAFATTVRPDIVMAVIGPKGSTVTLAPSPSGPSPEWAWQLLGPPHYTFSVPETNLPVAWRDLPAVSSQWVNAGCVIEV